MEMSSPLAFYVLATISIACSLLVVFKRNPIASAMNLILVFFCFAGIYVLLEAHLVAAMQVMVYAGAIMVLFVFVMMLLGADGPSLDIKRSNFTFRASVAAGVLITLGFFIKVFNGGGWSDQRGVYTKEYIENAGGNTQVLSELMFSEYILPFELTSVLLLAVIVGTVAIAMRKKKAGGQ